MDNFILLILCLLLEIGQILDIITTNICLKKSIDLVESNPFFKIKKTRKIPFYCIFLKCFLPIFLFFIIRLLVIELIFFIFLIIIGILTLVSFIVVLNNIIIIKVTK